MATTTPEVRPATDTRQNVGRRGFLASAAGGLTLAFFIPEVSRLSDVEAAGLPGQVNAWLQVGTDGSITLTIGSSEMGQGSMSGLAQVLAEELVVDYAKVKVVQGGPSLVNPVPVGAAINTVGSSVIRTNFWKMRDAAASARETLVQAAMNAKNDQTRSDFTVSNGVVTHVPSGTLLPYAQLASAAALLQPAANAPLIPDSQFKLIGKTVPRVDIPSKVNGSAKYGLDVRVDGMVYAVIKHCPTFGGTLASTPSVPSGMLAVVPTKVFAGTGRGTEVTDNVNAVAVVGPNTWDTWQAAKRLNVAWNLPSNAANLNNAKFLSDAQTLLTTATPFVAGGANPAGTLYTVEGAAGNVTSANTSAAKIVEATYTLPYVSHACMEVLNCTVNYVPGVSCEVWAPTQSAKAVLSLVIAMTGLPASAVTVHTMYLGGGLGRKAEVDFVSQAVQVAMQVKKPVKLMWPREEDFTRDQYRPMGVIHGKAGLDSSGNILGWSYRNVSPSILGQRGVPLGAAGDSQGIEGAVNLPYNFGARVTEWVSHPSPIPVGFWRSVGASLNTFGVECMIDELAFAAGQDPYQFRRAKLTDPRWIAVLDAAAVLGNWTSAPPSGRARGIAIGAAFNSIVAEVVEISNLTTTGLRVNRVSCAIDCYIPVNPGSIQAQLQGGIVHGLNAALYGQQTFVSGVAQAKNFNKSRMIRLGEMPQIGITIIPGPAASDRSVNIGGAGELGVPTFAPALANAYFKLTGKRVRSLPLFPGATMGGL
ncbi:MAG: xanthine dehydrogenase family protein molybdopterin-binding subunit [Acidobacteria bacterium]|nr:xanthine dehydrogenase family protein molybdopterin-binding subunit [Acidobacteriota bacterium]